MGKRTQHEETDRVDAAFNRVLAQEARAGEQLKDCEAAAAAILADAEARAQRIKDRVDHRIRRAHQIADAQVERSLADLLGQPQREASVVLDPETLGRLDQVIGALIDEMLQPQAGDVT